MSAQRRRRSLCRSLPVFLKICLKRTRARILPADIRTRRGPVDGKHHINASSSSVLVRTFSRNMATGNHRVFASGSVVTDRLGAGHSGRASHGAPGHAAPWRPRSPLLRLAAWSSSTPAAVWQGQSAQLHSAHLRPHVTGRCRTCVRANCTRIKSARRRWAQKGARRHLLAARD